MANTNNSDKWYFTKEQLENTPSRKCGYDGHKELSYRQQAANFIQDMGQRLKVSQLCINTAIVYMHRFYVFHSFTHFPWHQMAAAALFLAAKVEEQPRKLEYVIRVANICRNPRDTSIDINSERYITQSQDLVFNENVLLQTLGFDVAIDHPHTHVVRCCHLVRASKDLAQTSYFMASNSLHLTTMCIQYKPTVVACFCILVACKWSNWEIPLSNEKKEWYSYMDPTVTDELLQQLTEEFLVIFEACPSRLKEKIMAIPDNISHTPSMHTNSPFDTDPKKVIREDGKDSHLNRSHESKSGSENDPHKHRSRPHEASSSSQHQREREYKERKERERLAAQQKALISGQSKATHGHHRPPIDPKLKPNSRPSSVGNYPSNNRTEPRDILREASRDSPFGLATKDFRETSRDQAKESNMRDPQSSRSDNKEVQKRDYLLKPNVQTDINSLSSYSDSRLNYSAEKQRIDPNNRSRMDLSKIPNKHDSVRRHDESKPYLKSETDNIKKHLNASAHDKNSAYLSKSLTSTSQKIKSPFSVDASKSVPKQNINQVTTNPKLHHNGNNSGPTYNASLGNEMKIKTEPVSIKEEIPTPAIIKRPSLFSPEKTPPYKKSIKQSPSSTRKLNDTTIISALSPLSSPVNRRSRNYSSGSEPELRPVMKKIDQVEGFENLMRDNTIGINKIHQIPDVLSPPANMKQENNEDFECYITDVKPSDILPILVTDNAATSTVVNGLETNPTLISNLLKETPSVPHLPVVTVTGNCPGSELIAAQPSLLETKEKEHHHHKSKKKNKEKHKHKDKDRNREDKEKKKKHKDKDREKHKYKEKEDISHPIVAEPIKIKIHKDKIQPLPESSVQGPSIGLKIKIPKDKLKTESISELSQAPSSGGLKIKIPKEKISNCNSSGDTSKKRERDRSSPLDVPPSKVAKTNYKESKQNGRHSYNKVSNYQNSMTCPPPPRYPPDMSRNSMPPGPIYPPPPPPSVYYYPQVPPPNLQNVNIPPPTYIYSDGASMYTQYYHQGYIYPPELYQQPPPMPQSINNNPPLPKDAPPRVPPPPPPE